MKACDIDGNFYILTRRFRCKNLGCRVAKPVLGGNAKGANGKPKAIKTQHYSFSMLSEGCMAALPPDVQWSLPIPPVRPNYSGHHLTYRVIRLMVGLGGSGATSAAAVHKVIKELHRRKYMDAQLQYYSRASSDDHEDDHERFSLPTVSVLHQLIILTIPNCAVLMSCHQ